MILLIGRRKTLLLKSRPHFPATTLYLTILTTNPAGSPSIALPWLIKSPFQSLLLLIQSQRILPSHLSIFSAAYSQIPWNFDFLWVVNDSVLHALSTLRISFSVLGLLFELSESSNRQWTLESFAWWMCSVVSSRSLFCFFFWKVKIWCINLKLVQCNFWVSLILDRGT